MEKKARGLQLKFITSLEIPPKTVNKEADSYRRRVRAYCSLAKNALCPLL